MKKNIHIIFTVGASMILVVIVNLLLQFDPNPNEKFQIVSQIVLSIWTFSVIPSFLFFYHWLERKTFGEGIQIGNLLKWGVIFVPILIAPYFMVRYYILTIKNIISQKK